MAVPPIISYAFRRVPRLLAPLALVYATQRILQSQNPQLASQVSTLTWVVAYIVSLPLALTLSVFYGDWRDAKEARKHGAVLAPQVYDKWPGGLTMLGDLIENFKFGYLMEPVETWAKQYGNILNIRIFFANSIFTSEPDHIKAILATQFDSFEKGPLFIQQMHSLLGSGVFNSDGDMWKFHRSMTRPFFSKDRISHFELFGRKADSTIDQLKARLREGHAVDIQDAVSRFTLDSATEFLFGQNVNSLSAGLPYPHTGEAHSSDTHPANVFARAFGKAQHEAAFRFRFGAEWPLTEPLRLRTQDSMDIVRSFIDPILTEALAKKRDAKRAGILQDSELVEDDTLLDYLVKHTDDETVLRDETLNIMIAGRDTTATTLTFAVYLLARHPKALARLREEILSHVGSSRPPTYEDLREMKYLRAVVNETLRLYPAVPFNARTTRNAVLLSPTTPGGKPYYIPPGIGVQYSVWLMHRRTDLWGPDAAEFDPDRFLDERLAKYLTPNPFIFLPFNAGPRICLGQQFAYHESSFFLVRLLQAFSDIQLAPDAQPAGSRAPPEWKGAPGTKGKETIQPKSHLTLYAHEGIWVRMQEDSLAAQI
ncbi:hypothetical protein HGRIS_009102 [Hohenbuehelia grisea]|uniref:Cytochrome P450 n=1 Tax=Hohenbuehelia grisea TaxID=104357 RepID=A0ABR3J0G4_9AGAR